MTKNSCICSSVEGKKLIFNTRQFYSKPPVFNDDLKRKVYPFKLGINGYVEIETPLDNLGEKAFYKTSLTEIGDAVQGGSIDGWSIKPIGPTKLINATGTHSAKGGCAKGHSYAHVQSSPREHLQSATIQSRHPEVIQIINPIYNNATSTLKLEATPAAVTCNSHFCLPKLLLP